MPKDKKSKLFEDDFVSDSMDNFVETFEEWVEESDSEPVEAVSQAETDTPLDSFEVVWYKQKYQTSLVRKGGDYFLSRPNEPFYTPVSWAALLLEIGVAEEEVSTIETQLWVRGLAVPEQVEKLSLERLADLVADVRKRNK